MADNNSFTDLIGESHLSDAELLATIVEKEVELTEVLRELDFQLNQYRERYDKMVEEYEQQIEQAAEAEEYRRAEHLRENYVPLEKPAEQKHDPGRRKWLSALSDGLCELEFKDDGRVVADFSAHLDQQNCWEFQKSTPAHIRANIYGAAVQFESADRFRDWINDPSVIDDVRGESQRAADDSGVLSRVTRIVRG